MAFTDIFSSIASKFSELSYRLTGYFSNKTLYEKLAWAAVVVGVVLVVISLFLF